MHLRTILVWLAILASSLFSCSEDSDPRPDGIRVPSGKGHENLSDYNFFQGDLKSLTPDLEAGVISYDLNTPLFSDYALKKRFIYVPEGKSATYKEYESLDFPIGSVLIKHFYYEEQSATQHIETRLIIRKDDGWQPEIYIWNDEMTEAKRSVIGGSKDISITVNNKMHDFNYKIPNQNQCKNCHAYNGKINPIGPQVPNLNKIYNYDDGVHNQIDKWIETGILQDPKESFIQNWPSYDDESVDLNTRARVYLSVNCSSCHRREGSAANSGLYLGYDNQDSLSLGFWKTPVAAGDGSGGLKYVINPGRAEESILFYRMNSTDIDVRMPELGRELIHQEGITLIKNWIESMK